MNKPFRSAPTLSRPDDCLGVAEAEGHASPQRRDTMIRRTNRGPPVWPVAGWTSLPRSTLLRRTGRVQPWRPAP